MDEVSADNSARSADAPRPQRLRSRHRPASINDDDGFDASIPAAADGDDAEPDEVEGTDVRDSWAAALSQPASESRIAAAAPVRPRASITVGYAHRASDATRDTGAPESALCFAAFAVDAIKGTAVEWCDAREVAVTERSADIVESLSADDDAAAAYVRDLNETTGCVGVLARGACGGRGASCEGPLIENRVG